MGLEIAGTTVDRGSKSTGFLEVGRNADNRPVGLPYIIVNGKKDGPIVEVDSSVDGDEPDGVDAILRLAKTVRSEALRGTLILIPVVNPPAYLAAQRLSPLDGLRMGSLYPGDNNGRISERLAYAHFNEFVKGADYVITCHCGGGGNVLRNFIIAPSLDVGKVALQSLEFAKASGIPIINQVEKSEDPGTLLVQAPKRGIKVVMPEIDTEARAKDVEKVYQCIVNLLRSLRMLEGNPVLPKKQVVARCNFVVRPNRMGLWQPLKQVGDRVSRGELVGRFLDPFTGDDVQRLESEFDGIVSQHASRAVVTPSVISVYAGGPVVEEIENG